MKPIKVFHWRGENFGDALSRDVVAHVSGRPAVWSGPVECDLFAVGSVISLIDMLWPGNIRTSPPLS